MSSTSLPRSAWLLSLCQATLFTNNALLVTVSALIGKALAPDGRLATVPMAMQFFAMMCTTVPASLLMGRIGRKAGFLIAGVIGMFGASIAIWAILNHSFVAFCAAAMCFGMFSAFGNYYRFTAAEVVEPALRNRAISLVMAGGVLAAFIGPNLANWSHGLFPDEPWAGPFAALYLVYLVGMIAVIFTRLPLGQVQTPQTSHRSLSEIALQPGFIIAVTCQALGYGVMNLIMSATPLAMHHHDYPFGGIALVIQWHVVAMFAPSFFTGRLIDRFGLGPVLNIGAACGFACIFINLQGTSQWHFLSALVLLGISWNFLFVGGTTLLSQIQRPEEKSRTQALNDFIVFSLVTITAMSAGILHDTVGWTMINLIALPMLIGTAVAILALQRHKVRWAEV